MTLEDLKNLTNNPKNRKLLFGRSSFEKPSGFEKMLELISERFPIENVVKSDEETEKAEEDQEFCETILDHIFREFCFWDKPHVLVFVSTQSLLFTVKTETHASVWLQFLDFSYLAKSNS